jgi:trans-2,3-dihydro-3-hydroxyanthranilate isomerase
VPLAGNGLAVLHDADALDDASMLAFARETQLSETSFIQSPTADGATYRNRIWTVGRELLMAGHPSLGAAVAEARVRKERSARYVQQTPAGLQPVEVELRDDGRVARAEMLQEAGEFHAQVDPGRVAAVCGLETADLHPDLLAQWVATGVPQLIVPLVDRDALLRARPGAAGDLSALITQGGGIVVYMAVVDDDGRGWTRAFWAEGPQAGEDPATGSAVGPLCAYLDRYAGISSISVAQGAEMGRPWRLDARIDGDGVRVGGDCVVVLEGDIVL